MLFLYTLFIYFLKIGLWAAAPFHPKLHRGLKGRRRLFRELQKHINSSSKTIWFHCASVGEFEQAKPLIESTYKEFTDHTILLSFFSPSGYEIMKDYDKAHYVCYLPLDTKKSMNRFLEIVRAVALILVKYEFWPNMISEAYKKNLPIYSISAVFRKNQLFFKFYGNFMRTILKKVTHFFVQNENSRWLLNSINIKNVTVCGDTRFDCVRENENSFKSLPKIEEFKDGKILIVAGSTWPDDEQLLIQWIKNYKNDLKVLLVPHEIHHQRIRRLRPQLPKENVLYSHTSNKELKGYSVMILDGMGLLKYSYALANIAYIGGGFQKSGIHNILEAATFGIPVLFGPEHHKSIEAKALLEHKGAFTISHLKDLTNRLNELIKNPSLRKEMGNNARNYVQKQTGATLKILAFLKKELRNP